MPVFERHKNIQVNVIDENKLEIIAHMKDKFHEIKTSLVLNSDTLTVEQASAEMIIVPFDLCREVTVKMNELVGLELKRGILKWVQEIIGKNKGCAHLVDLVIDSVKAAVQVSAVCFLPEEMPFEEKLDKIKTVNMGICHTYSNLGRQPKFIGNRDF